MGYLYLGDLVPSLAKLASVPQPTPLFDQSDPLSVPPTMQQLQHSSFSSTQSNSQQSPSHSSSPTDNSQQLLDLDLGVFYWNCRSIVNKLRNFSSFICSTNFKIIALTETWLHPDVRNGEFLPPSYQVHRYDRPSRGGGVLLALDHSLSYSYSQIPSLSYSQIPSPIDLELVCVKLSYPSIFICVVYFPPSSDLCYFRSFFQFLSDLVKPGVSVIVMGDFNIPDICWSSFYGQSLISDSLCDLLIDLNLSQLVSFPTHSGGNILDLIISNIPDCIKDICPVNPSFLSSKKLSGTSWFYNFQKTDIDSLNEFLLDFDFKPMLESSDIEYVWSFLKSLLLNVIAMFTPLVSVRSKSLPKWFSSNIRHQLNKVHTLRKKFKRNSYASNFLRLASAECLLQLSILDARSEYEASLVKGFAQSRDPSIYRYLKSLSASSDIPSVMYHASTKAEHPKDIANLFNSYFFSVFHNKSNNTVTESCPTYLSDNSLCSISLSKTFLKSLLLWILQKLWEVMVFHQLFLKELQHLFWSLCTIFILCALISLTFHSNGVSTS